MLPETWVQLTILLAAVVPGFVYQFSRRQVAGPDPEVKTLDERILHSVVATGVFAGAYAVAFGPAILRYVRSPERALDDIQFLGLYFVGFAIVLPWLTARIVFYVTATGWFARASARVVKVLHLPRRSWDPTPSAWDFAFSSGTAGWVRVRFADGTWLGGSCLRGLHPCRARYWRPGGGHMSDERPDRRKWIAPSSGGYSGLGKDGRAVPRPATPPKTPATPKRSTPTRTAS